MAVYMMMVYVFQSICEVSGSVFSVVELGSGMAMMRRDSCPP